MPKRRPSSIDTVPPLDLAYAVGRLIATGKTTQAEIVRLAAERAQRIADVEAELKALTRSGQVSAPATARKGRATAATKATATKAPASGPVKLKLSPKLRAFRKVQGLYAGYLRGFTGDARERIRQISASEGPASAVEAMKGLLREKAKAAKATAKKVTTRTAATKSKAAKTTSARPAPAAAKRATASKAARKLKITPKRKAQLKVQGTYIGLLRGLPVAEKARMKALAAKSGMAAAVEVMRGG